MARRSGTDYRLALARLKELMVDPSRFSTDEEVLSGYLEAGTVYRNLIACLCPRDAEDIRRIAEVARGQGLSVYTPIPWGLNPPRAGVVVDFRCMADIVEIDTRNLFACVEPWVTWEQLMPELTALGVRVALPASAKSRYVLESALEREVVLSASRFSNKQLSTFHAVLADGREYRSGSDALPGSKAHWREDGGPNISRVFTGSRNSFWIPVRGYVFLFPQPESRKVVVRGFANRAQACRMAQRAARGEIGTEVMVLNKAKASEILGEDPGFASWSAVFGLEGSPRLVAYHEKRLDQIATELKLKPKVATRAATVSMARALEGPWYAPPLSIGFYTEFARVDEMSAIVESRLKEKGRLAQMVIPVKRGASVYAQLDLRTRAASDGAASTIKDLLPALSDAGAFFPNPTWPLATHIFSRQPTYFELLKNLKRFMDPDDMLNTRQVVEV